MEWHAISFDWNRIRAFLITAEEGSLSAAARASGTTQPTLGRQVSALEDELGVILFDRVGGKLVLTDNGKMLLEHVRAMGESAAHISRLADGQSNEVRGKITLSASEVYCAFILPPIIERLRVQEPCIDIEIIANNEPSDLIRREADIAIRNFRPIEQDLITRKIGDDVAYFYATPAYLASIGNPDTLADYSEANFIGITQPSESIDWLNRAGLSLTGKNFPITTKNHLVHWEYVKKGLGIGIMTQIVGDLEPLVVKASPTLAQFEFPIWLVSHRELSTSRRVRIVFDLLVEMLGSKTQ